MASVEVEMRPIFPECYGGNLAIGCEVMSGLLLSLVEMQILSSNML
jgi:hypothetical protein